jgi:hypothetical protein
MDFSIRFSSSLTSKKRVRGWFGREMWLDRDDLTYSVYLTKEFKKKKKMT